MGNITIDYPDSFRKMKDTFGMRKIPVFNDDRKLRELLSFRIEAQKDRQDSIYLVCASEGMGKSLATLHIAELYKELTGKEIVIEDICRTLDELMNRIAYRKREWLITLDEGSELDSSRWNEKKSKEIKEKFVAIRERAFIILLCYTNPVKISKYLREDRCRGIFFIKNPGEVWFYPNSPAKPLFSDILSVWDKDNTNTKSVRRFTKYKPDFIFHIPEYKGVLREQYNKRKDDYITTLIGNDTTPIEIESMKKYELTQADVVKALNIGPKYLIKIRTQYNIPFMKNKLNGREYYSKEDIALLKSKMYDEV